MEGYNYCGTWSSFSLGILLDCQLHVGSFQGLGEAIRRVYNKNKNGQKIVDEERSSKLAYLDLACPVKWISS